MMKRTTVMIDETLLDEARAVMGDQEVNALVNEGLRRIVRADNARRLIALGGSDATAQAAPRNTT